jgi:RimJ/RimL family protein N-acetyltransferase
VDGAARLLHLPTVPPVILLNIDAALAAEVSDVARLERSRGVRVGAAGPTLAAVVEQSEAFFRTIGAPPRWGGYLAVDADTRDVVGTCAFKGGPGAGGWVEIAYFTLPEFEGRGYATAMAAALVALAIDSGEVGTVRAHTLPERNASARVLTKLGFTLLGEVEEPEDGTVWRWERPAGAGPAGQVEKEPARG